MNTIKEMLRRWLLDDDRRVNEVRATIGLQETERPPTTMVRSFTINEAINGSYITFTRRKYNPNGPDDYLHEIYIVQPDESLIDAISTVLVLTEK